MTRAPTVLAFSDLDDTLFQTRLKCEGKPELQLAADHPNEARRSFTTAEQRQLLNVLQAGGGVVIPVTGRSITAMSRVHHRFPAEIICDHGATVLEPGGNISEEWAARVQGLLSDGAVMRAEAVVQHIARAHGCALTTHHAGSLPYMHVLKHPDRRDLRPAYQALRTTPLPGLTLIANSSHISVLHAGTTKASAVEFVRSRYPADILTLGLGDSLSDLPFMRSCPFWLVPTGSQIDLAIAPERPHL